MNKQFNYYLKFIYRNQLYIQLIIIVCVIIGLHFIEGYQNNTPPPDKPDDTQFYACHDYSSTNNLGNNNYYVMNNPLPRTMDGNLSDFIEIYGLRSYDAYHRTPICDAHYNFENISDLEFREIPDGLDVEIDDIYELEATLDQNDTRDPNFVYINPEYIQNKLIYDEDTNQLILRFHRSSESQNLNFRLDSDIYN